MKALVVLSGGQDSTTVLFQVLQTRKEVYCLTIDYGQRHELEVLAARRIVDIARKKYPEATVEHEKITVPHVLMGASPLVSDVRLEQYTDWESLPGGIEKTFVPLRNQFFLTLAANRAVVFGASEIYIGVSQEDFGGYPDCRSKFIHALEAAINIGLEGAATPIVIQTPLMHLTKAETVRLATQLPGCMEALAYSHTAYDGKYPPTGRDHATLLRAKGFAEANEPDPLVLRAWKEGKMELPDTPNYTRFDHEDLDRLAVAMRKKVLHD